MTRVTDGADSPLNRFAIATTQKLCFYANSTACDETDPEFRRVVGVFQTKFDFLTLVKELFASPLVTGAVVTQTFPANTLTVSVSRRDHFCAALSTRLGKPDLCVQSVALPTSAQTVTATIAGSIAADGFSRSGEAPVTPWAPTLVFRAGIETLCENLALQVVDAATATVYSSTETDTGIRAMAETIMGYAPDDPKHDAAIQILQAHYTTALGTTGNTATTALRSTFVLACESPTSVSRSDFRESKTIHMTVMTRREGLLRLFGTGYIGLRALATGLPVWYLLKPVSATAADLQCAIDATQGGALQYLVVSASSNGDPINCNCPGTYEAPDAIHPQQVEVAQTQLQLGSKTYGAALPWASMAAGGALSPAVLQRIAFFHHSTRTTVHGDQPKVMSLLGGISNGEMMVSAFAKHLAPCFGTVQDQPIAVGVGFKSSEILSYSGSTLPAISPLQLKQILLGSNSDPLIKLRSIRDSSLNQLNALARADGTGIQQQFLDALASTQPQVRSLSDQLAATLNAITGNDVTGQGLAAAALIAANVTPVVTIHIGFGGDNHSDPNLQAEADQHVTGVQGIQSVMDGSRQSGSNRQGHLRQPQRLRAQLEPQLQGRVARRQRPLRQPLGLRHGR